MDEQSGIYSIKCSCNKKYFGQSRRAVKTRWTDHNKYISKNEETKSAMASHILHNLDHNIVKERFEMVQPVRDSRRLDCWESILMHKHKDNLINTRPPPLVSELIKQCI